MKKMKHLLLTVAAVVVVAVCVQAQNNLQASEKFTISSQTDADAPGGTGVSYEWYREGVLIPGCTAKDCEVPANLATGINVRFYRRAIANGCAIGTTANSNVMTVTFCNLIVNGVCWADRNMGTNGDFATDNGLSSSGYFQFNRTKAWPTSGGGTWVDNVDGGVDWQPDSSPCPTGWRMPTQADYQSLNDFSSPPGGVWVDAGNHRSGVAGRFYGPRAETCTAGDLRECVFFPATGLRYYSDGALYYQGTGGYGWSSTQTDATSGRFLHFYSGGSYPANYDRKAYGFPVRCVR